MTHVVSEKETSSEVKYVFCYAHTSVLALHAGRRVMVKSLVAFCLLGQRLGRKQYVQGGMLDEAVADRPSR
jgi:hypothetical protein